MSINEFIEKHCRGSNGIKCGQDDGCIFVNECRQDHEEYDCEEFVVKQLMEMVNEYEPNITRD